MSLPAERPVTLHPQRWQMDPNFTNNRVGRFGESGPPPMRWGTRSQSSPSHKGWGRRQEAGAAGLWAGPEQRKGRGRGGPGTRRCVRRQRWTQRARGGLTTSTAWPSQGWGPRLRAPDPRTRVAQPGLEPRQLGVPSCPGDPRGTGKPAAARAPAPYLAFPVAGAACHPAGLGVPGGQPGARPGGRAAPGDAGACPHGGRRKRRSAPPAGHSVALRFLPLCGPARPAERAGTRGSPARGPSAAPPAGPGSELRPRPGSSVPGKPGPRPAPHSAPTSTLPPTQRALRSVLQTTPRASARVAFSLPRSSFLNLVAEEGGPGLGHIPPGAGTLLPILPRGHLCSDLQLPHPSHASGAQRPP